MSFWYDASMMFPSARVSARALSLSLSRAEVFDALPSVVLIFTFAELVSFAVSRVSSGAVSMYFREAKSVHEWFADSISLQIMVTECLARAEVDACFTSLCCGCPAPV